MVDRQKLDRLLLQLRHYTEILKNIVQQERQHFLSDPRSTGAARYYLQISIESCINIANHIIATERLRAPEDYKDTFRVLAEAGILTEDNTRRMRELAGLRNLLVHVYAEVDDALLYESAHSELVDFATFAEQIIAFVEEQAAP